MARPTRMHPRNRGGELLWCIIREQYDGDQAAFANAHEMNSAHVNHLLHGRKLPSLRLACQLEAKVDIPCVAWLTPPKEKRERSRMLIDALLEGTG